MGRYSLITNETKGEYVNQSFHSVEITSGVDGIDGAGVQSQVDKGEEQLGGILVHGRPHAVRIKMGEETRIITMGEFDEGGGVIFVLNQPSLPEIAYAFLCRGVSKLILLVGPRRWNRAQVIFPQREARKRAGVRRACLNLTW